MDAGVAFFWLLFDAHGTFMHPQLKTKLASWVEHGIISAEQAEKITAHEGHDPERPWALYGIAGIGVTALVTGIVSLIAANWYDISAPVKLGCYFALLGCVGYAFYRYETRPGLVRETLLTLFVPLVLAGIGLIAQVYNLHGDGWQALLLWLSITLPVVCLAQSWATVHLWTVALLVTSFVWAEASHAGQLPDFGRVCIVASLPLMFVAAGCAAEHHARFNAFLRKALLTWGALSVVLVGTLVANLLWVESNSVPQEHLAYVLVPWFALGAASLAAWLRPDVERDARLLLIGVLLSTGTFMTLPLLFAFNSSSLASQLLGATGFFATWILVAAAAAHLRRKRWFDLASLVIAVRVVVVYFEVFGSLAMTGLGLIFSGTVVLGIAFAWHKFRGRVRQQLGGGA
jgi:uncharacterized membrane protein